MQVYRQKKAKGSRSDSDYRLEIHHNGGHVTHVNLEFEEMNLYHPFRRIGYIREEIKELLEHVPDQLENGSEIFLVIKSKANVD